MKQAKQVALLDDDDDVFDSASVFEKEISDLEEIPPVESPSCLWGRWGFLVP
ncbi:hypothetical protein [Jejubacter calystegiae]|uniref:hypothetical protein n=1 Tax=Jejubacter calystegiae TaxID=2579935 RepID=UPI00143DC742|nr:hypothetical protein [Jejubacter calystegiae]